MSKNGKIAVSRNLSYSAVTLKITVLKTWNRYLSIIRNSVNVYNFPNYVEF